MPEETRVTVYHGTSATMRELIDREGLRSQPGRRGYVYVTTDREQALYYARAWTARLMVPGLPPDFEAPVRNEPIGLVIAAEVDARLLKPDPYNPVAEPCQFKLWRGVPRDAIVALDEVEFADLRDREKRMMAFGQWIGVTEKRFF